MNLEFQPKYNSTKDGLTAASGMKSSSLELKGLKKRSICFKDLLSQTKNGKNPQNTLSNEKLTVAEIGGSNRVLLKEASLSELFPEIEKIPVEEKNKDEFPGIMENDLMSLLQGSQNLLLTTMNDTRISINFISGSQDLNQRMDLLSESEGLLAGAEKDLGQMKQLSAVNINSEQNFGCLASSGDNNLELMESTESSEPNFGVITESLLAKTEIDQQTKVLEGQVDNKELIESTESLEPILAEITESLLVKTEIDQQTKVLEGQVDNKELIESTESLEPILAEMAESLLTKTETKQKTMVAEDEKDLSQRGINEIPLMTNMTLKNPEIQTIEQVALSAQIEQEIVFHLDENKPITFQMRLDPENLGEIDIRLKFDQGKLIIDIMAFNKETQALLLGQIDKLIKGLALQNVQVESVHLNSQSQNSNGSDNKAFMMNMGMDFTQDQKQSLSKENLRDQHNFSKETSPDNDHDLVMGIEENEQRLKNKNYKINVLV
ncbi:MAG: flagellar hook-length control protein FliK [Acetobacterium sp.]